MATIKPFNIVPTDNSSISVSGFYMNGCIDFNAEYNENTGSISIPSGIPVFDMETYMVYLYPWDSEAGEEILSLLNINILAIILGNVIQTSC